MDLVQVESVKELRRGRYGIFEPVGGKVITDEDQESLVVFVPGVAFDIQGNRLGRGSGWYDRMLERLGDKVKIIGLAYEFQLVEELPIERWDRKMHHVITEERIIDNTACIPEVFGSKLNINCIHSFWILFGMGAKSD